MSKPLHIWITGASSGIGNRIVHTLASSHNISVTARSHEALANLYNEYPKNVHPAPADVLDAAAIQQAHTRSVKHFGNVDILIQAVGTATFGKVHELTVDEFDEQIAVNLRAPFLCTRLVLPAMLEKHAGMIISLNSVAAIKAFSGGSAYGASKAGLLTFTRCLREEVRKHNIKVCDVLFGATATGIWNQEFLEAHQHRMMNAQDVAGVISTIVGEYHNPRTHWEEIVLRPQEGDL